MAAATKEDLDELVRATGEAIGLLAGLLAEAAGAGKLAYHFGAARDALRQTRDDPLLELLLQPSYRLVLRKARNRHPDDPIIRDLFASEFGDEQKH